MPKIKKEKMIQFLIGFVIGVVITVAGVFIYFTYVAPTVTPPTNWRLMAPEGKVLE